MTFAVTVESELFAVDTGVTVAVVEGVTAAVTAAFHGFFTTTSGVVAVSLDVPTVEDAVALGFT
ncbi:hypothetical protein EAH80_21230 [Mycobacterium hodleri]|uniref:Uncharacterized protein n=1 Tax=Mycolicibacterium hodleri TaxID=49897 RepID=A0A502E2R5_9MYCO|nr:hypothetical protein EAH80_21230 [Mycolicibacterium hodleri]